MSTSSETKCVICGKQAHIACGLVIQGKYICDECERQIVYTTVLDRKYDFYKNKLKEILSGLNLESETTV
ncbi:MAG: sigma factor G inhibitor Gin [Bacillota bacterium]